MNGLHLSHDVLFLVIEYLLVALPTTGLFVIAALCLDVRDTVRRRARKRMARHRTAEQIARIDQQAAQSVARIQSAFWQAQQRIREEAQQKDRG